MTKIAFIADERSGRVRTALVPTGHSEETHAKLLGGTFIILFLIAVVELIYLLAR